MFSQEQIIQMIQEQAAEYVLPESTVNKYRNRMPTQVTPQEVLAIIEQARGAVAFIESGFMEAYKKREEVEVDCYLRGGESDILKVARKAVVMDDTLTLRQEIDRGVCKVTAERVARSMLTLSLCREYLHNSEALINSTLKRVCLERGLVFLFGIKNKDTTEDEFSKLEANAVGIIELSKFAVPRHMVLDMRLRVGTSVYGYKADAVQELGFEGVIHEKEEA